MSAQKKRAHFAVVSPEQPALTSAINWTPERCSRLVANLVLLLPEGQGLVRALWVAVTHSRDFDTLRAKCEGLERLACADTSVAMQSVWRKLTAGVV